MLLSIWFIGFEDSHIKGLSFGPVALFDIYASYDLRESRGSRMLGAETVTCHRKYL
jgi:hypothetical protein